MYVAKHAVSRRKGRLWASLLLPGGVLYLEILLRLFDTDNDFWTWGLLRTVFFSLAAGVLIYALLDLLPWRKVSRGLAIAVMAFGAVFTCVEYCCKSFFSTYFGIGYMKAMAGQVVGDFFGLLMEVIFARIPFILLTFIPMVAVILLRRRLYDEEGQRGDIRLLAVLLAVALHLGGFLMSWLGVDRNFYTYDVSANVSIPHFGVLTSMRLELQYAIFGIPEAPLPVIDVEIPGESEQPTYLPDPQTPPPAVTGSPDPSGDPNQTDEPIPSGEPGVSDPPVQSEEPPPTPVVYGYNVLDIDFAALAEAEKDEKVRATHQYMAAKIPSQKNEYTGYFAGKNLILITAEAFSPYVISEELTPTLYRLSNEGFVFKNYYQPNWTQSTTGGEFAVMTGLIPTWIGNGLSFRVSAANDMSTALGWQFGALGYNTLAYHNNSYTYYGRNETHPNLGYDFYGIGNGLEVPTNRWPNSDLEMIDATADSYIRDYVENGTNFHAYYMTVSGHCNYNWAGNAMARKHQETAQAAYPNYSESVQAYIACNLEVEYAIASLLEKLEAAGIADETVIVLTADHYPYAMAEGDVDYYNELTGMNDSERVTSRYRNSLIMWCGSMEEPVVVDTPCSALDIVPTISNLFGLDYDSRLYSGRDVFATNYVVNEYSNCMPLVIFANTGYGNSWITAAGTYEADTKTFTPNPGVEVADNYVSRVNRLVQAKYTYAKVIIQTDYYGKVVNP